MLQSVQNFSFTGFQPVEHRHMQKKYPCRNQQLGFERGWFPLQNVRRRSAKTAAMAAKKMHDQAVQTVHQRSSLPRTNEI
jgi:hypothetical protein